jgi:hypothetical protein
MQAQWEQVDAQLTQKARQDSPPQRVKNDGRKTLKVATRFGWVALSRSILSATSEEGSDKHQIPANAMLPEHGGMLITRGLQLLPQDLSFTSAARLLAWQTQQAEVLSASTLRHLVREQGQILRKAQVAEAKTLLKQVKRSQTPLPPPRLIPLSHAPRRRAGWPVELNAAVEEALNTGCGSPPKGVSQPDWDRVLLARRNEATLSVNLLRFLGPGIPEGEVLVTADEVLTRAPEKHHFNELRTACIKTAEGARFLSGTGARFLLVLTVFTLMCAGQNRSVRVIADGARWIRGWFVALSHFVRQGSLLLDWFHLVKRCTELSSMICRGIKARDLFLKPLLKKLWHGEVDAALAHAVGYRDEAKNLQRLDMLLAYLRDRRPYLTDYRSRRNSCEYIGSGHVGFDNPAWPTLTANFGPPCDFSSAPGPRPARYGKIAPHEALGERF